MGEGTLGVECWDRACFSEAFFCRQAGGGATFIPEVGYSGRWNRDGPPGGTVKDLIYLYYDPSCRGGQWRPREGSGHPARWSFSAEAPRTDVYYNLDGVPDDCPFLGTMNVHDCP